ncbi:MAG: TonB-dependent receptor [Lautropia sp.]|nr:TonB-dependent receptor [Lautropia sp.]
MKLFPAARPPSNHARRHPPIMRLKTLAVCLATLPWLPLAQAQQTAPANEEPSTQLPDVTVTAKGYAAERAQTPASTVVLDTETLKRRLPQNPGEALRWQPGLSVNSDGAQGQNPVIRGLKRDSIVLLVDGMRFNSAQPSGAIASFISLSLAERVELVKGPASVLYGTGALGGVINVQLPQARFEPGVQAQTRLSVESANRGVLGTAVLNGSEGDHALMLGAAKGRYKDYHSPDERVSLTGYKTQSLIGQYRFRLDADQQLRLSVQQHEDKAVWYPGAARPHPNPRVGDLITHSPEQHRRLHELGYRHQKTGAIPLNVDVRLYRQEMRRTIFGHSSALGHDIVTTDVRFRTDGFDARADWQANAQHLLAVGLNLWRMEASPDAKMAAPPSFAQWVPSVPFHDGVVQAAGVYVQDDMRFGALNVLAGLRHDRVKGSAGAMNNGRVTTGLDRSDGATSGSLGAVYTIHAGLRPFVNLSRAFRAADLRERYQSGPRSSGYYFAGSPQIAPEVATQLELGLKGATRTLHYSVSAYRNRIDDYITGTQLNGQAAVAACGAAQAAFCKQTVNLGHVTMTGLEAELRWRMTEWQWLRAGYSMIRGENHDLDEPLYQVPADTLHLGWDMRLATDWQLDADWYLVRRQDRVATRFTRGTENETPGYGLVDLGATWRMMPGHSLRVALKNVGDKRYHEHLAEGISGRELPMPGRSLQVSWQGTF